ncbi:MAG: hypothetical protein WCT01_00720 [Candidatus Shapirobacteria bacterium]
MTVYRRLEVLGLLVGPAILSPEKPVFAERRTLFPGLEILHTPFVLRTIQPDTVTIYTRTITEPGSEVAGTLTRAAINASAPIVGLAPGIRYRYFWQEET